MGLRGETDKMKQWLMLAPLLLLSGITQAGTLTVAPEQYGAIGDCEADDTAAFRAMNAAILDAQANDQLLQVTISFPPSRCYHYTWNRWLWGIRHVRVLGHGSTFQNIGTNVWSINNVSIVTNRGLTNLTPLNDPGYVERKIGYTKIATVAAGSTSVIALNHSEVSLFSPNQWALVYSYDQQLGPSAPPNARFFDYVRVTSVNTMTGVISLDRPLVHTHRQDFPDVPTAGTEPVGAARIAPLEDSSVPFTEDIYMENMTFLPNPAITALGPTGFDYFMVSGAYSATVNNVRAHDFVPSVVMAITVENSTFSGSEPDKLIDSVTLVNVTINNGLLGCAGVDKLKVFGGHFSASSTLPYAFGCMARHITLNDAVLDASGGTFQNIQTNWIFPTKDIALRNVTFIGTSGSVTMYPPQAKLLTVDGMTIKTTSTPNQIHIPDISPTTPSSHLFVVCLSDGGYVGLKKGGAGQEYPGKVRSLLTDNTSTGAMLTVSVPGHTVQTGDVLNCYVYPPGSFTVEDAFYVNASRPIWP
jgi:hypothetical protein